MLFFKRKISHFLNSLIEQRRLAKLPVYEGDALTFQLLGHIANSQLEVEGHLQQLVNEIALQPLTDKQRGKAREYYSMGATEETELFEASLRYFKGTVLEKELLLQRCWRMIWADRHLGMREYQLVHLFGFWLGWERADIEKIGEPYRPVFLSQEHRQALMLLGVSAECANSVIKQAYKRQLAQSHPDKIMGAGGSEEAIENATIMTIKIHEAYALIRMLHGF